VQTKQPDGRAEQAQTSAVLYSTYQKSIFFLIVMGE
jgi:hypothetical protein